MGQFGGGLQDPNVMNPQQAKWGDLSGGEQAARVVGGGIKGLGPQLQNYFQQKTAMANSGGRPGINPLSFIPSGNNINFYGGS